MKKTWKTLWSFLLVSLLAIGCMSGCAQPSDSSTDTGSSPDISVPGDTDNSGDSSSTKVETTIEDAIDKTNPRPDFDSSFDYESGYVPEEPPEPEVEVPEDTGTKTTYRLEAENAEAVIAEYTTETDLWKNTYNDYYNLGFDLRLSGCLATRNLNKEGTKTIFKFHSDKTVGKVEMNIMYGGYPNTDLMVAEIANITVNSRALDVGETQIKSSECTQLGHNQYMIFKLLTFRVNLQEGENVISIESLKARGNNFDYIELKTSAKITEWDSTRFADTNSVWTVTQAPTLSDTGTIEVVSTVDGEEHTQSYTLPTLGEGNGYAVKENGDEITYSFTLKGKEYSYTVNSSEKYTLTLQTPSGIAFEGGAKTALLRPGSVLPAYTNTTGRSILGWYNVATGTKYTSFSMPASDCTIAPYFDAPVGFTALDPGSEQSGNRPQAQPGGPMSASNFTVSEALIAGGADGYTVSGRVFTYNASIAGNTGAGFRMLTRVQAVTGTQIKLNTTHTFCYNLENKGTEVISLRLYMVNKEYNLETVNGELNQPVDIVLQPGESMSFEMKVNYAIGSDNNNCMSYFRPTADMSSMKLGMAISVKLGS